MSERTSEFFDRYAVDFDSIYGNDNKALERIANRLFRHAMLVRYQKTIAGCQPAAGCSEEPGGRFQSPITRRPAKGPDPPRPAPTPPPAPSMGCSWGAAKIRAKPATS